MTDGWGDASGIEGNYEDDAEDESEIDGSTSGDTTESAGTNATSGTTEPNASNEASETNETASTNETKTNIKDEWNGRTIYIPDGVLAEMEETYLESQLKLRKAGRDEFKKNRHFYPLLVQFGLEALSEADADEITGRLSDLGSE